MADLLPCPFCGSEARSENYVIEAAVLCAGCPAKIIRRHGARDDNGLPEAIAAWNTRATQPPAVGVDVSEEIVEQIEQAVGMSTRGWDMVDPKELIRAVATALRAGGGES